MNTCTNCVLPANFPGVRFDEGGLCNYCRDFKGSSFLKKQKAKYENDFLELIKQYKGKSDYDCLVCYSGGKDSTYTLDILRNQFDLSLLAVTFDNGFISPAAMDNIKKVVERTAVDHLIFKIRDDLLKKLFSAAAFTELFPKKTLERASTICTCCMSFVKFMTLKIAMEKGIPMIAYGWSPGQAPIKSSIMKTTSSFIRMTQKVIFAPLYEIAGDDISPYFLGENFLDSGREFPYYIHPLAFLDYEEEKIYRRIEQFGWKRPEDTDPNSTNCLLNSYANHRHEELYGYNPYVFEVAKMVREGVMSREEGLRKFSAPLPSEQIRLVKAKLGV